MAFVARDLDKTQLPRKRDIIEYLMFKKGTQAVKLATFVNDVAKEIVVLWENLNIPLLSRQTVRTKIDKLIPFYRNVLKRSSQFNENMWNELLMVSKCQCFCKPNFTCDCTPKTPLHIMKFLRDQRYLRMLTIPGNTSTEIVSPALVSTISSPSYPLGPSTSLLEAAHAELDSSSSDDNAMPFVQNVSSITLPNFSAALDKTGVSNRFGALLATNLLKDLDMPHIVIDQDKISRERKKRKL